MRRMFVAVLATVVLSFGTASDLPAQGLIWSLPEDGMLVRYKGIYKQTVRRPNAAEGDLTLTWDRIVEIRSVGAIDAEYEGQTVPCRWIEIKVETGKSPEGVLDAGPGGIRMYKLLVPESEIRGSLEEPVEQGRSIFASHIPIVKGYRKIGDEPSQEMESKLFNLYPIISLLQHYDDLQAGPEENVSVLAGDFNAVKQTGSNSMETNVYRSINTGEIDRSEEIPFGVVAWKAKTIAEAKGSTDQRSEFRETAIIEEEMKAIAIEQNAQSEILLN